MTENTGASLNFYATTEQSEIWKEEADEMGLSYSEYYRMMIAAGRREFGLKELADGAGGASRLLEERVIDTLDPDERKSFEQITQEVVEAHLEEKIAEILQTDDRAIHDPRAGGYYLDKSQ